MHVYEYGWSGVGGWVGGVLSLCPERECEWAWSLQPVICCSHLSPFKLLWVFMCVWPGSHCRLLIRPGNHCMLCLQIHFHSLQHTHTHGYPDEFTKRARTSKQTHSTQLGLRGDWRAWYSLGVPSAQKCLWQVQVFSLKVFAHTDTHRHAHTSKHVSGLLIEFFPFRTVLLSYFVFALSIRSPVSSCLSCTSWWMDECVMLDKASW